MKTAQSIAYMEEMDRQDEIRRMDAKFAPQRNVDFSDLEDDVVDGQFKAPTKSGGGYAAKAGYGLSSVDTGERFIENCPSCKGSGRFISWAGRDVGPCFKCKGKGKLSFKNPKHVREAQKAQREQRKANNVVKFSEQHEDVVQWINANTNFEFARSLGENLTKFGSLTDGQITAARRCIERQAKRTAERSKTAITLDATNLYASFRVGIEGGSKRMKLRLSEGFEFSLAKAQSHNAGMIYVTRNGAYKGKINQQGQFFAKDIAGDDLAVLTEILVDPEAQAIAYGKKTGNCSCCGKMLTVKKSIERGIGPICASKYGW